MMDETLSSLPDTSFLSRNRDKKGQSLLPPTSLPFLSKNSKESTFVPIELSLSHHYPIEENPPFFDSDSPLTMDSSVSEEEEEQEIREEKRNVETMKEAAKEKIVEKKERWLSIPPSSLSLTKNHSKPSSTHYRKLTFKEVERSLGFYEEGEQRYIHELDILITYLKGQTQLYSLSHYLTQLKINWLTIPSFLFSIAIAVLAPLIDKYVWSGILISALTASIASLFACVRFYELDASCTTYLILANQYNKMQLSLETLSNSFLVDTAGQLQDVLNKVKIMDKIKEVEHKMTDMKDSTTFLPPEEVKILIPIIFHMNIFSFIKKMKTMKTYKISQYRDVKNEIRFILNHWENHPKEEDGLCEHKASEIMYPENFSISLIEDIHPPLSRYEWKKKQHQRIREKKRMSYLLKKKKEIRHELNDYRNAYSYMDELFSREINIADRTSYLWVLFRWVLGFSPPFLPHMNPVVDKYLEFILSQSSSVVTVNVNEKSLPSLLPPTFAHYEEEGHSFDETLDIL